MVRQWLVPLLASWIALSGVLRHDATTTTGSRDRAAAMANVCDSAAIAPAVHSQDLARRVRIVGIEQFLSCGTAIGDRVATFGAVSSQAWAPAFAGWISLHHLQIRLQV
jgi:hypothetical protein